MYNITLKKRTFQHNLWLPKARVPLKSLTSKHRCFAKRIYSINSNKNDKINEHGKSVNPSPRLLWCKHAYYSITFNSYKKNQSNTGNWIEPYPLRCIIAAVLVWWPVVCKWLRVTAPKSPTPRDGTMQYHDCHCQNCLSIQRVQSTTDAQQTDRWTDPTSVTIAETCRLKTDFTITIQTHIIQFTKKHNL